MEVYLVVFWVKKDCWAKEKEDCWAKEELEDCWAKEELEDCWVKEDRWLGLALVSTPRLKMLSLDKARASWKVLPGGELVLNLYSKLTFNLPGIFLFLSGSSVETNITSHIALTQDTPGHLKLVIKDCSNLYGGIKVNLRKGFFTNLVSGLLNSSLRTLLPALFCPLVNIWFSIINIKLQFLNRIVFFGLLGKIQSALSSFPMTLEHSVELDLQNYPFPAVFIDWLLQSKCSPRGNPGLHRR
ncbi:BPI fold-containing family B member 4-like protein [Aix galericulata]|nr:BPI fold-containing family B member 4-like protein [Aix galericulata]